MRIRVLTTLGLTAALTVSPATAMAVDAHHDRNQRDGRHESRYQQDGSRQDGSRQDRSGNDGSRQDGYQRNRSGNDRNQQDGRRQDTSGNDRSRHDGYQQDRSRQDGNRQGRSHHDKYRQDKFRHDRSHQNPAHKTPSHQSPAHRSAPNTKTSFQEKLNELARATAKYQRLDRALADGYRQVSGCVPGMGYHYGKAPAQGQKDLVVLRPNALVYAPQGQGGRQFVAVEYVSRTPATLFGRAFDPPAPGVPYYTLHVWLWKYNPHGVLNPTNPRVVCNTR
ncbi:hypothetical protein [Streptomyces capparidis]